MVGECSLETQRSLSSLLRGDVAEDHLIGGFTVPHREHRDGLDVELGAVEAAHHRFRRLRDVALMAQRRDALQHGRNGLGCDEGGDGLPDECGGRRRRDPSHAGLVDVHQSAVLMYADGIWAVLEQPVIAVLGGFATRPRQLSRCVVRGTDAFGIRIALRHGAALPLASNHS